MQACCSPDRWSHIAAADSYCRHADIYEPAISTSRTVSGSFQPGSTVVAVRAFSWQLFETDGFADIGRYFEAVSFGAGPVAEYLPAGAAFDVTTGVLAPQPTTFPADTETCIDTVVLSIPGVHVAPTQTAAGSICESSKTVTFKCEWEHMAEQEQDAVPIHIALP